MCVALQKQWYMQDLRFSRKDYTFFITAIVLLVAGYAAVAFDPVDNGFGILTLWIAPPVLLAGFILPIAGIAGAESFGAQSLLRLYRANPVKHLAGAAVFFISFGVYLRTLEPTASLWDCSEFIASAFKLQVSHTPGTPLSILIARLFTMLSFNDVKQVAWTINMMSGLFSALTVWIVYYTIHLFIRRLSPVLPERSLPILAALGGSLCLAFSDSFWFSAVEAETYAAACFFLMALVWLILDGRDLAAPLRARRLVLIAYVAGLAYCIHPMCLLALPILPFTWYTNARKLTYGNVLIAAAAGFFIVFFINRAIAIGLFQASFSFDLFFVNTLHLPFYSGAIILFMLMVALFYLLLQRYPAHAAYTWASVFLLAGFTPYMLLFLRSAHNPPIDETNPENLYMIKAYMNRESYPTSPLVFGPYYDAAIEAVTVKSQAYAKGDETYELSGPLIDYRYEPARQTILPRLYSRDPDHIEAYRDWLGLRPGEKPTFSDNLRFMFTAQLGHMYLRYFLFNLAGRESDVQGSDWLRPWDSLIIAGGHHNRARNQYWMLPLLAGVLGMVCQYKRDRKGFFSVLIFFLITGPVLALYLNSPPVEPRERDYIYVGSYIAFFLWTGTGLFAAGNFIYKKPYAIMLTGVAGILLPLWMAYQNYDDHDRSGRTFQIDSARNTLRSCAPNAILFTGGDNDTFPLWYLQEVEGFRTDVRVVVLSYFNTDWYINQLRKGYYQSQPFALTLDRKTYRQYGPNDVLYVQESIKEGIDATKYLQLLKQGHPALTVRTPQGDAYNIIPSRTLKVSTEHIPEKTVMAAAYTDTITKSVLILKLTENYLYKNALALIDLVVSNQWQRPIYFNYTSMNSIELDLTPYLVQEGSLFRLQPYASAEKNVVVDKALAYKNLIEDADYSNLADTHVYFNHEDYNLRIIGPLRQLFNSLAAAYLNAGDPVMAEKVLLFAVDKLYASHLQPSYTNLQTAELLLALGKKDVAKGLVDSAFKYAYDAVEADRQRGGAGSEIDLFVLRRAGEMSEHDL